jgi:dihydroorotate dehydrogenase
MYPLIRKALFTLPPETAHHFSLHSLKYSHQLGLLKQFVNPTMEQTPASVMGLQFSNRVGLAAGLDKDGEYIDALAALGFGFIEVGTVTPRPQSGNPQPRLFRLPQSEAIINRMGFNSKGVDYLIEQVKKIKFQGVLGINIGKNFDTAVENAVDDYLLCLEKVYVYASYITVNISSPNTPGLRSLQYGDELQKLVRALKQRQAQLAERYHYYVPLTIKVAPDLNTDEIQAMADIFLEEKIDALIATNTTLARDAVAGQRYADEQGGLSGKPVTQQSTQVIQQFQQQFKGAIPIIGVGGISSCQDAQDKFDAGADLLQIYTGFVYQGAGLIHQCLQANKSL